MSVFPPKPFPVPPVLPPQYPWPTVGSPFLSNFGPTLIPIPATAFGVKFDGVTDDTALLQNGLDAAQSNAYDAAGNDKFATLVQLPPGRGLVTGTITVPPNVIVQGHGNFSTWLYPQGFELSQPVLYVPYNQTTIRDLAIVNNGLGCALELDAIGGATITGDTLHIIERLLLVGGGLAIYLNGGSEIRLDNIYCCRNQSIGANQAAVYLGGADHMISRITVSQPGSDAGGISGIFNGASNSKLSQIKVFGGVNNGNLGQAVFTTGYRCQYQQLEVQDFPGNGVQDNNTDGDIANGNTYNGVLFDSIDGYGFSASNNLIARAVRCVTRAGGAYTTAGLFNNTAAGAGLDIEASVAGTTGLFDDSSSPIGSRIRVNGMGATAAPAAAATLTPDPYAASEYYLPALTEALTIENPSPSLPQLITGMRLAFQVPQGSGDGYDITFGDAYATIGAIVVEGNTLTTFTFVWNGPVGQWIEQPRETVSI